MANQMIALGAKAPQSDPMGTMIARNTQLINTLAQQKAAERQAAVAQQQMDIARAQEGRAVAKEKREASAAEIELAGKKIDHYTKLAGQTMNPQGYALLLNQLDKDAPDIAAAFRTNLPPEKFDRNVLLQMVGSIGDNFKATYGPLETEVVQAEDGTFMVARTGGFGEPGVFEMEQFTLKPKGATSAPTSTPAPAGGLRPTRGVNTTPDDLRAQMGITPERLEAAARAAARGARATDPIFDGLTEDQFRQMQVRADEIRAESGGASLKPASFGEAPKPDLGAVVQQMMQTGVVSQSDFEAMRAAAPGKDEQLAQILRANNIKIMPDEQQPGGTQSAVYRPGEGDATMTQTQSMDNYVGTGRAARGKSPMQGPLPGSAQVPIPRVREEARAARETPEEAAAKTRATKRAEIEVDREKSLPAKRQVSSIVGKIRAAYEALDKAKAIPSSRRGGAENVWDYLSVSAPGREIQRAFGTETSKHLTDITASRKLLATAIKNATGMSAQEMNSNVELQLMLDALTDPTQGYEAALSVLGTIEELYGAPKAPAKGTPTGRGTNIDALLKKYGG